MANRPPIIALLTYVLYLIFFRVLGSFERFCVYDLCFTIGFSDAVNFPVSIGSWFLLSFCLFVVAVISSAVVAIRLGSLMRLTPFVDRSSSGFRGCKVNS